MQIAKVTGHATSISKHKSLVGMKLLLVQCYHRDNQTPDGFPVLTVDFSGARLGDEVIITSDSKMLETMELSDTTPLRWSVMGIKDS